MVENSMRSTATILTDWTWVAYKNCYPHIPNRGDSDSQMYIYVGKQKSLGRHWWENCLYFNLKSACSFLFTMWLWSCYLFPELYPVPLINYILCSFLVSLHILLLYLSWVQSQINQPRKLNLDSWIYNLLPFCWKNNDYLVSHVWKCLRTISFQGPGTLPH